jgi:hypothetical protein
MAGKTVVAVSPLDGDRPFSGPAARFMKAAGFEPNDEGVISILGDVDHFIVSRSSSYPGRCIRMDTRIDSIEDSMRLAKEILRLAG